MPYDNTNSGVLFINDKKGNPKAPDRRGKLDVNGHEYELAGWLTTSKDGKTKFLRLKISEPRQRRQQTQSSDEDVF